MAGWSIFAFLVATAALALVSKRTGVAYPIVFVVAGTLLGFIPNLPRIELQPDQIFLIVLPVVLFAAGWTTDLNEFKRNLRPIGLLAIGLVVFTTVMVAAIAHAVIPGMSWAVALTLGAIVAPTDAIAAESIADGLLVQRRVIAVISGESLVNDASALIVYRFAIAAAVSGAFAAGNVIPEFFLVSLGGIAVGLIAGVAIGWIQRQLRDRDLGDEVLVNVIALFSPFASYLPAEALGVSGVLSTVACGIYLSRRSHIMTPDARIVAASTWEMLIFLVNAFAFLLLGLQLHGIVTSIGSSLGAAVWHGAIITVAVVVLRFVWVYPATYLPRLLSRTLRERDPYPSWRSVFVIGWSGMRGIVSLAAALALPLAFPSREAIVFVTFSVIFGTLVVMGLTLPTVIRRLAVHDDGKMEQKEIEIRIKALESGLKGLRSLEPTFDSELAWEVEGRIIDEYQHRILHLNGHLGGGALDGETTRSNALDHRLQTVALQAEREEILALRKRGEIPDEIYRHIQYDLDLAETRLGAG